jgi:hypothetical protein
MNDPVLQGIFMIIIGVPAVIAVVWLLATLGGWIDDAFEEGRWGWSAVLLLLVFFPTALLAWLIVRAMRNRPRATP